MKDTKQCCLEKDHTFCHFCDIDLHDNQIDQQGCDDIGIYEALCKPCVKEYKWLDQF